jgi:cyclomaltodextrinase
MNATNRWPAPKWVRKAIFYEIFPDRFANGDRGNDPPSTVPWEDTPTRTNYFGGDLQGIMERLSYLEALGIDALYLTPIFQAKTNHKYDTSDYLAVDPAFGDTELLRRLVEEAHKREICIVLDAVFNHCGDGFWAFEDLKAKGERSRYASWFHVKEFPISSSPPSYQAYGSAGYLPKLNTLNPEVQEYLLGVATHWIETCGIDGWRLDVPWRVPREFWRRFRERVKGHNPSAYIVAEIWRNPGPWIEGDTCDGVMNYPLRDLIIGFCVNQKIDAEDLNYELDYLLDLYGPAAPYQLNLLGSHDTPRILTLCQGNVDRAAMAATFQFTFIGAPMIYYGDEVGLLGADDPDCRRTMPWDSERWNKRLQEIYRALIRIRRENPALTSENFEGLLAFNNVYAYARWDGDNEIVVVLNAGEEQNHVLLPLRGENRTRLVWRDLLSARVFKEAHGQLYIDNLQPLAALVLRGE